jgi:hypothetical protein
MDDGSLVVTFEGEIYVNNPKRYLTGYLDELARLLPGQPIASMTLDFVKVRRCNDVGFYAIKDIVDAVQNLVFGPIMVRRLAGDEWQQEALPILLNLAEESNAERTTFENVQAS